MSWKHTGPVLAMAVTVVGLAACRSSDPDVPEETPDIGVVGVVDVMVEDYSFSAPPTMRSGWTTFKMTNEGKEPHFMLLYRLPEGTTFDRYTSGKVNQAEFLEQLGDVIPEWFGSLEGIGGVGLIAPGRTAQTSVWLEPGNYVMECYLVSSEGKFHNSLGMLRPLIVTEERTGREAPAADISITLSNYEMTVTGETTAGEHTVAVHATENAEGLVGHDVHLARLAPEASIEDVIAWMSWIDGMRSPPPAEFLGGTDHVGAGRTSYMNVSLEPGRYTWISEGFASQGMVQEFVVEP